MQFMKIVAVTFLVAVAQSASATPIHLVLGSQTDIMSFAVSIVYDASDESFTANGFAASWTNGGVTTGIMDGVFDLSATIDFEGHASGGSLTISDSTSTLLTGNLVAFGFDDEALSEPDPFEFLFENTTVGSTVGAMLGPQFGVILTSTTLLPVNPIGGTVFEQDFSASYAGIADAAVPIPEPGSAVLMGLGLVMLSVAGRTRRDTSRE
jgi:hypothetical protein